MNVNFRDERFETDRTPETASKVQLPTPGDFRYPFARNEMTAGAYESIQAGIEQLAVGHYRVEQSYMLFTHALELLLKSALLNLSGDIRHAKWLKENPHLASALARKRKDPAEWAKIIKKNGLREAFNEVASIFDFSEYAQFHSKFVRNSRNKIVHRGGDSMRVLSYIRWLLGEVFPILDEVLSATVKTDFATVVHPRLNRELIVIGRFLGKRPVRSQLRLAWHVLHPFQVAFRFVNQDAPEKVRQTRFIDEDNPTGTDSVSPELNLNAVLPYIRRPFVIGLDPRLAPSCRICDKPCMVQFEPKIRENGGGSYVKPLAVRCEHCGLFLTEKYPDLARIHYGFLNPDMVGSKVWMHLVEIIRSCGPKL